MCVCVCVWIEQIDGELMQQSQLINYEKIERQVELAVDTVTSTARYAVIY